MELVETKAKQPDLILSVALSMDDAEKQILELEIKIRELLKNN